MFSPLSIAILLMASTPSTLAKNNLRALKDRDDNNCQQLVDIELKDCVVIVDQNGGFPVYENEPCSSFHFHGIQLDRCEETPYAVEFLYNGGDCSQSTNTEMLRFECTDNHSSVASPPPVEEGTLSYVVVSNPLTEADVYFEDWVAVGSTFGFGTPEHGPLTDGFRIQIYDLKRESILQEVTYQEPLCQSNMEMLNVFGASQIVSYSNVLQGQVSPFASIGFSMELALSVTTTKQADITTTTSMKYVYNMNNLTSRNVITIEPGVIVSFRSLPSFQGSYSVFVTAMAKQDGYDALCTTTELFNFDLGISGDDYNSY